MKLTKQIQLDLSTPFSEGDTIYTSRGKATFLSASTLSDAGLAKDEDGTFAVYTSTTAHTLDGWKWKMLQILDAREEVARKELKEVNTLKGLLDIRVDDFSAEGAGE